MKWHTEMEQKDLISVFDGKGRWRGTFFREDDANLFIGVVKENHKLRKVIKKNSKKHMIRIDDPPPIG